MLRLYLFLATHFVMGIAHQRPDVGSLRCPYLGLMEPTLPDYHQLLAAVEPRVREDQYRALQQVNHRELQCLVAVELKITKFQPEYAGKLNFYLSLLNEQGRKPHEPPSIGIITCQGKQRTVVGFALRDVHKPIGVATIPSPPRRVPSSPATRSWCGASTR